MKTIPSEIKFNESNESRSGLSVKSVDTEVTAPAYTDDSQSSYEEVDLEGLDELERDLLDWAKERKPKSVASTDSTILVRNTPARTSSGSEKSGRGLPDKALPSGSSKSPRPSRSPRASRSPMPNRSPKGANAPGKTLPRRTKSVELFRSQFEGQKAFENRLQRAMTLNSYDQKTKSEESDTDNEEKRRVRHPEACLNVFLQGVSADTFKSESWETYFIGVTPERVAAHTPEVPKTIRKGDLKRLKKMHASGVRLDGCNKHGESTISLACRLGKFEIVKFLVEEAKVSVRVRDDSGRTPLHDACWTPTPNFELIRFILNLSPELLFITDYRGFPALRYIPQSCWEEWCTFIEESLAFLRLKIDHSEFLSAHCKLDGAQERLQALMRRATSFAS
jgi:Ankyrin repeats (3 copies)